MPLMMAPNPGTTKKARTAKAGKAGGKAALGAVKTAQKKQKTPKIIRTKSNLAVLGLMQMSQASGISVEPWPIKK